ncbi:hypothetical protein WR25_01316 [Diploscapter pachys]|uniref:Uncharacterized protein n=1 Tax=Diploscapter pachys TaxID=2018661 RepID=A0A2A2L7W2_9BILA|nr:hypothetical protein WR25_01316 [Diploscapter pachys]
MKYFLAFIACAAAISVYSAYATLVDSLTDTTFTTIYEILNELKNLLVSAPAGQIAGIISSLSTQIMRSQGKYKQKGKRSDCADGKQKLIVNQTLN